MLTKDAAIAANRFGLGARPGEARSIGSDAKGWLLAQLENPPSSAPAGAPESARVLAEVRDLRVARQIAQQARANLVGPPNADAPRPSPGIDEQAIREFGSFVREHYVAQTAERHKRAIETHRPFVERLVHFWSNHFAVSADKQPLAALAGLYEQEAIRPNVTGNFYDLLLAVERHPAMILYLDNQASMGRSSQAATLVRRNRGRELGLNENLAREILELHTLGVDGGYTQADVTEFAKVLTGWSIGGTLAEGRPALARFGGDGGTPGEFHFRAPMHEPGDKTILGNRYRERGVDEGEDVLRALALHPKTASHLATKLARHFVADDPPAKLVERLSDAYLRNEGDLTSVYRVLIESAECWREPLAKFKTPHDFAISAYRLLDFVPENLQPVTAFLTQAGQRPYAPGSPAGWPDTAASWNGGDALLKRIEFATAAGRRIGNSIEPLSRAGEVLGTLGEHTTMSIRGAESGAQAFALLLASPEFQRR
ncbi:MAG TPA: DUF1800 domain-containing protein [Gammaproteobacteria bacterium]|nr:DUF1800 domain-containing protein [Gammaproteobacteria bacterium]